MLFSRSTYRCYFHVLLRLFSHSIITVYTRKDGYSLSQETLYKYIGNDHHGNGSSRDRSRDELIWDIPLQSPSREGSRDRSRDDAIWYIPLQSPSRERSRDGVEEVTPLFKQVFLALCIFNRKNINKINMYVNRYAVTMKNFDPTHKIYEMNMWLLLTVCYLVDIYHKLQNMGPF